MSKRYTAPWVLIFAFLMLELYRWRTLGVLEGVLSGRSQTGVFSTITNSVGASDKLLGMSVDKLQRGIDRSHLEVRQPTLQGHLASY